MEIRKARKEDMKEVQDLRYLLSSFEKEIGANISVPEWGYTEVGEKDYNYFLNKQFIYVAEENEKNTLKFYEKSGFKKYNVQMLYQEKENK